MENVISVKNLSKKFTVKGKKEFIAVDDISFDIDRGEIISFIGPNGAGKSTTIKMLIGILMPTSGDISVLGMNPSRDRQKLSYSLGTVFGQKPQLWFHLPAIDSFRLLARIYNLDESAYQKQLKHLTEIFNLAEFLEQPVRKLSLGQRMRLEIAASLLHRPKIIFLDEPTIGLDITAKQKIRQYIKYINEKEQVTIFLTSHDVGDIEQLAQRTIIINEGKLIFDDATTKLRDKYLKTKNIEIISANKAVSIKEKGFKTVETEEYKTKFEIDTSIVSIEKAINIIMAENSGIIDINIYDTPLEEIIAQIYVEK